MARTDDEAPRPGLREVFATPGYRRLWTARTISQWGDTFGLVALGLLVFDLTGTALGVSGVVVAEILPVLLLAPVAGTLVDRWPRTRVMIASDLFRLLLAAGLAVWHTAPIGVYAIAFAMSVGAVFFNPAAGSVLPALVRPDALVAANSGIWTAAVLSQIALAPVAGLLVAGFGYGPAFGVNAVSYAASALVLRGLRVPRTPVKVQRPRWWIEAREGLAVLVRHRVLRALAAGQLLAALSAGATSALLVVLARERLGVADRGYGLLIGAIGIGAGLGPLALLRLVRDPAQPRFVFGAFGLRGISDLFLASVASVPVAATALAAYGVGTSTGAVTFNSVLMTRRLHRFVDVFLPRWTCCGREAGSSRSESVACSPTCSVYRSSTTSGERCSWRLPLPVWWLPGHPPEPVRGARPDDRLDLEHFPIPRPRCIMLVATRNSAAAGPAHIVGRRRPLDAASLAVRLAVRRRSSAPSCWLRSPFAPGYPLPDWTPLASIDQIVELQLERASARLGAWGIRVRLDPVARRGPRRRVYDPEYGARPLRRLIEREILDPIARALLAGEDVDRAVPGAVVTSVTADDDAPDDWQESLPVTQ